MNDRDFITIEPGKRSGKPCIRGLRVTACDVLDSLASDMTHVPPVRESAPFLPRPRRHEAAA